MDKRHQMSTCNICKLERCTFSLPKLEEAFYLDRRTALLERLQIKKQAAIVAA
jgi:hypothetical protein